MAERNLFRRADGRWGWRLKADNGQVIATDGGQGYENKGDARDMADAVISGRYAGADETETTTTQ